MKSKWIIYTLLIFLLASCKQDKKESTPKKLIGDTTPQKVKTVTDYWSKNKETLNISEKQMTDLQGINKKYSDQIKALPKQADGKRSSAEIEAINLKKENEIKTILGEEVYQKKLTLDNKRKSAGKKAKANPDTKRTKKKKGNGAGNKLQQTLQITDAQMTQLRSIQVKYSKQLKAMAKVNGKRDTKKIKTLRSQEVKELKNLLGENKYNKLLAFEKNKKSNKKSKK